MTDPVRKSVTVPLRPDEAFRVFTDRIGDWWPDKGRTSKSHTSRRLRMEPGQGGRLVETQPDGASRSWGRITGWTPGAQLVIAWSHGHDAEEESEVRVTFTSVDQGTRVDLVHDLGAASTDVAMLAPWGDILRSFANIARPVYA